MSIAKADFIEEFLLRAGVARRDDEKDEDCNGYDLGMRTHR